MKPPQTRDVPHVEDNDWRVLVEEAPTGLMCLDLHGRFEGVNRRCCDMLGFTREELLARTFAELTHPDDRASDVAALQAMASGSLESYEREKRYVRKDGSVLWVELRSCLVRDATGVPKKLISTMLDVTRRKIAEDALRESERRFRTLFEQAPFSVQLLDKDGRTLKVNESWIELWGFSRDVVEAFILREYRIFQDPQLEELGIAAYLRKAYAGQSVLIPPALYDPKKLGKEGRARWVIGHAHPIKDESGAVCEVVLFHYDVTERIEAEAKLEMAKNEAEAANRSKSTFLATMSHEFRTPLNAILGFTHLLKNEALAADERQRFIDIIERSGRTLTRVVDDLLDISKIEAGVLRIERTLLRPREVIEEALTLLGDEARKKGLQISCETDPDAPEWLETDPVRFKQILINLVSNALKYTSQGSVRVRSFPRRETEEFVVAVQDTGPGIPQEEWEKLFKLFSRVHEQRGEGGTGLGLALSRKLAHALGGDVVLVQSQPGVGSTFALALPLSQDLLSAAHRAKGLSTSAESAPDVSLANLRVLIVDDALDNRLLVERILTRAGATTTQAESGMEALAKARSAAFDVILMDIQMPGMDGFETTRQLRRDGYDKPIIALTALAMPVDVKRCYEAGCDAFLAKPVDVAKLVACVKSQTFGEK